MSAQTKNIELTKPKTDAGNELIAKYLGWFKEKDEPNCWYEISGSAQVVAYSIHKDQYHELPFHKDWGWMMKVIEAINRTWEPDSTDADEMILHNRMKQLLRLPINSKIETVWLEVVDFIEQFNALVEKHKINHKA